MALPVIFNRRFSQSIADVNESIGSLRRFDPKPARLHLFPPPQVTGFLK